jgi:hypothetical protein
LTAPYALPVLDEAKLLGILGRALTEEGRPLGARLAFDDALSLIPPEAPGAKELTAWIRAARSRLDQPRNR